MPVSDMDPALLVRSGRTATWCAGCKAGRVHCATNCLCSCWCSIRSAPNSSGPSALRRPRGLALIPRRAEPKVSSKCGTGASWASCARAASAKKKDTLCGLFSPAGGVFLPRLAKATAPFPRLLFASRSVCVRYFVIISSFAFAELQSPSRAALRI